MKLFGIEIAIHWSYWIMIAFFMSGSVLTLNYDKFFFDAAILAMLLILVIGHELAHALTARKFGYQTQKIIMNLLGGVAIMNMANAKPREEFWIALAGPLFNLVLGLPAWLFVMLNPFELAGDAQSTTMLGYMLFYFGLINIGMGVFNLLPAYPMDGGRILRSLLSRFDKRLVLNISNGLTIAFAVGFAIWGALALNPLLIFMAGVLCFLVWLERNKKIKI